MWDASVLLVCHPSSLLLLLSHFVVVCFIISSCSSSGHRRLIRVQCDKRRFLQKSPKIQQISARFCEQNVPSRCAVWGQTNYRVLSSCRPSSPRQTVVCTPAVEHSSHWQLLTKPFSVEVDLLWKNSNQVDLFSGNRTDFVRFFEVWWMCRVWTGYLEYRTLFLTGPITTSLASVNAGNKFNCTETCGHTTLSSCDNNRCWQITEWTSNIFPSTSIYQKY